MRHIAVLLGGVSVAVVLAGCTRSGVEVRFGIHAEGADRGELMGVVELPEGHPPVLPPGHSPLLPPGHPPIPGHANRCPGAGAMPGSPPATGRVAPRDAPVIISI